MSVDCDCAGVAATPPKAHDLGILASTDILAVDQASIDMVYKLPEAELHDLKERIESRKGLRQHEPRLQRSFRYICHSAALYCGSSRHQGLWRK